MGARCVYAALVHAKLLISVEACLKCVGRRGKSCAAGTDKVWSHTITHMSVWPQMRIFVVIMAQNVCGVMSLLFLLLADNAQWLQIHSSSSSSITNHSLSSSSPTTAAATRCLKNSIRKSSQLQSKNANFHFLLSLTICDWGKCKYHNRRPRDRQTDR